MNRNCISTLLAAVVVCVALSFVALPMPAYATSTSWIDGTGAWDDPDNWDNGLPGAYDTAYIDNGGTAQITTDSAAAFVYAGYDNYGNIEQTDGTFDISDILYLGYNSGSAGIYTLSGGTLSVGGEIRIGADGGSGTFTWTGGTVNATSIILGAGGTLNWMGGTLTANSIYVGSSAGTPCAVNITHDWTYGGSLEVNGTLGMASYKMTVTNGGVFTLSDGSTSFGNLYVDFVVKQNGGVNTISNNLDIGHSAGATGTYDLNAGQLFAAYEYIGAGGPGTFTQNGGTNVLTYIYGGGWIPGGVIIIGAGSPVHTT